MIVDDIRYSSNSNVLALNDRWFLSDHMVCTILCVLINVKGFLTIK